MEWLTLILTILLGVVGIRYLFWRKLNKLKDLGIIHEKPWPILGNSASIFFRRRHFAEAVNDVYKINEDALYVGYYDLGEPVIVIRSPELIKSIAVKNFDHFVDHRDFVDPELDPLFGKNLIGLRGEKWKEVRNLLSPAFTSSKMKAMFHLMSDCAKNFVDFLVDASSKTSNTIDTKDALTRYTNDVIATCAFGISINSMKYPKNDFYVFGRKITKFDFISMLRMLVGRSCPKVARLFNLKFIPVEAERFFENVIRETIETRDREGITRPDMIQLMMETRGKNGELTIQDMIAQAFIFFFGGFESTATLICFATHEIAVNADIQTRLRDEVERVLKETNGDITYEAVNGMQYLDAVISEALRLYPIGAFIDRLCVKSFELPPALPGDKPITIEPGQNIWFPAYAIHRDPKYYSNPLKFDPERFMGEKRHDIDPFTYLPFGQGPRMCIGNRFALLEAKVLIFHLLKTCYLKPSKKMTLPLELDKSTFVMMPKGGFWVELTPRENSILK